ncbi:phage holin family protein [Bifidobacterium choloepi]|uniref:Phage holin family protein n=1 Tax=Bifidobacterium choloepi TaxID=2614131 RepID=A0A6I5MYJ8_9BIFI|nr:phage holin family protein [Bifidobacterium choloepi]NEG69276.1 phage holin family protein [Bifidobacterium choloepi]
MASFLARWAIMTFAAAVMVALLPGMTAVGHPAILGVAIWALFMALLNASLKPVVQLLAMPFSILTFGLFALVINWLFMELASWLAFTIFGMGVVIGGFWWSVIGSLILTIVSGLVNTVVRA